MTNPLEGRKGLVNSSTPIVGMETVEELRALSLVRAACADLNMATFEWSIADGLFRSGTRPSDTQAYTAHARSGMPSEAKDASPSAIYNTANPVQALATLESMTVEAVFVFKDFHRHMEDPITIRRLRDVGQKFSANRRTLILTAPSIQMPPELTSLVEYFDLPLPDQERLREIVHETYTRLSKSYTVQLKLDAVGVDAVATNLRGLTEEEAERATSQAIVSRYALCPDTITDILSAKKELLRRSGMLEFIEVSDTMTAV